MLDSLSKKAEKLVFSKSGIIPLNWRMFSPNAAADYRQIMREKMGNLGMTSFEKAELAALERTRTVAEISNDPEATVADRSAAYRALNEALDQKWVTPSQLKHINKEFLMQEAELGHYQHHVKYLDQLHEIAAKLSRVAEQETHIPAPSMAALKREMDYCNDVLKELQSSGKVMGLIGKPLYADGTEHLPACLAQMGLGENACFTRIHGPYIAVRENNKFFLGYLVNPKENETKASYIPLHDPVHLTRDNINLMCVATDIMSEIVVAQIASIMVTGLQNHEIHLRGAQIDVFLELDGGRLLSLSRIESGKGNPIVSGRILGNPFQASNHQPNIEFARTFYSRYLYNNQEMCRSVVYDCNPVGFKPCDAYSFVSKLKKLPEIEIGSREQIARVCAELNQQKGEIVLPKRSNEGGVLSAINQADIEAAQSYRLINTDGQEIARFSDLNNVWSALVSNEAILGLNLGEASTRMAKLKDRYEQQALEELFSPEEPGM